MVLHRPHSVVAEFHGETEQNIVLNVYILHEMTILWVPCSPNQMYMVRIITHQNQNGKQGNSRERMDSGRRVKLI